MGKNRASMPIAFRGEEGFNVTGVDFDENGTMRANATAQSASERIIDKYNNFEGSSGRTTVDINSLANWVKDVVDSPFNTISTFPIGDVDAMYDFDQAFGLETYWEPYERQVLNKIRRSYEKNGQVTAEEVVDDLVESYIYQYNKEYKNQRDTNNFLRHEFKDDLLELINSE